LPAGNNPNWNDVKIFNEYEKKTNIDIDWTMIPFDALKEKKNFQLSAETIRMPSTGAGSRLRRCSGRSLRRADQAE
jgi:hypothetical protein